MDSRKLEITVGLFVALGLAALLMLALRVSNLGEFASADGYRVTAYFDNIGGLQERSPVRMAGVLVGRTVSIGYDLERYQARVTMSVDPSYDRIPTDTTARIFTAGLLGEQYISLEPGGADATYLGEGSEIRLTESALVLEQIIGQFLYSQGSSDSDDPF